MNDNDRIEKTVVLGAPPARVWRALTDASEFGQWFGVTLTGPFIEGQAVTGTFSGGIDEAELLRYQERLGLTPSKVRVPDGDTVFCIVERLDPERYFSFRWIPYGIDADCDPGTEPTTLVEFHLEPVWGGTRLRIVESGFERVPAHRRLRAFRMNEGGWAAQAENVRRHVEGA